MLSINIRMVSIFCACSEVSSKHMVFVLCPFLGPHLTTYHSNIGVHIIVVLEMKNIYFRTPSLCHKRCSLHRRCLFSKEASLLFLCCADVVQSLPKSSTLNSSLYMVYSGFDEYFLNLYHNGLTPAETLKTVGDVVKAIVSALEVS